MQVYIRPTDSKDEPAVFSSFGHSSLQVYIRQLKQQQYSNYTVLIMQLNRGYTAVIMQHLYISTALTQQF
jgi:hypothetical protein